MAGIYFLQKCICVTAPLIRRPRPLSSSMGDNLGHYGFVVCRAGGRAPLPLSMQPLLNFHSGQIEKNDRRSSRMGQVGSGGLLLLLPSPLIDWRRRQRNFQAITTTELAALSPEKSTMHSPRLSDVYSLITKCWARL
jgi:hypothetical protein